MTTPPPIPFPDTTPHARVFIPFVIIFDSDDTITTLPIRSAQPSPDRTLALYGYPLDYGDDSLDEDMSETAKLLHTQSALTSVYPLLSLELPPSSCKRSRLLLPSLPPLVPPPPKRIESVEDNMEASNWDLVRHLGP
nr:hypothetical protein [Tanacetum cinerariifolium]